MSDSPPKTLGPYRVEGQIGSGGMGAVFRAYDQRLDRHVAIKRILVLPEERRPSQRQRFLREARLAARLSHPAIVQVHDLLSAEGDDWIVMEWLDGANLASVLRRGPLSLGPVLTLGKQLCEGLAHAHRRGIIHRDLKPANVMVTAEGQAKILDFGLAKESSGLRSQSDQSTQTATGAILGTYHAMSPEQARGFEIDARSDLFSLGSLLYEALAGTRPFEAETPLDTLTRVCVHEPPPLGTLELEIPPKLSDLVEALLEKRVERRPQGAGEVLERLDAIQDTQDGLDAAPLGSAAELSRVVDAASWVDSPTLMSSELEPAHSVSSQLTVPKLKGGWGRAFRVGGISAFLAGLVLLGGMYLQDSQSESSAVTVPVADPMATKPLGELLASGKRLLETYYLEDDLTQAIRVYQEVLARNPDSAAGHAGLARAYWRRSYLQSRDPLWIDQALRHAQQAVGLEPFLVEARVTLALLLAHKRQVDEADEALGNLETLAPSDSEIPWARGELAKVRGQLTEAETAARQALELQPDRADYHELLGVVLARQGRLEEAVAPLLRSVELAPEHVASYRNLAGVLYWLGRRGEAADWMQKGLAIRPDASLFASLGILYFDEGEYVKAAEVFERAMEFPGGDADYRSWGNLGDAYRWSPGRESDASRAYRRAIDLILQAGVDEGDADLTSRLALFQAKLGEAAAAREILEGLTALSSREANVSYRVAVAWEILGERDPAWEALRQALESGYPLSTVQGDPELAKLTSDLAFDRLLAKLER